MSGRSIPGRRLDELLANGEWHDLEAVLVEVARSVPPGHAYRQGEGTRMDRQRRRTGEVKARQRGDQQTAVKSGARRVALEIIRGRLRRHRAVERSVDGVRQIRRWPSPTPPREAA